MKPLFLSLILLVAISAQAQLPAASPKAAGFDLARWEVLRDDEAALRKLRIGVFV